MLRGESGSSGGVIRTLGLVSMALVPFGSVFYSYSDGLLSNLGTVPKGAAREFLLYGSAVSELRASLETLRVSGAALVGIGVALLVLYVGDYVWRTNRYAEVYDRRVALVGSVAAPVWIAGVVWFGYLPAAEEVNQYLVIAESSSGAADLLVKTASGYERAVFDRAVSAGATVLGAVWWTVSLVSLRIRPDASARVVTCPACGEEVPVERYDECPYCSKSV